MVFKAHIDCGFEDKRLSMLVIEDVVECVQP